MPYKNKENSREYYINNKEKIKKYRKQYYRINQCCKKYKKEKAEYDRNRYKNNLKRFEGYYQKNKEEIIEKSKQWNKNNPTKVKIYQRNNKEKVLKYYRERRKTNPKFNLNNRMAIAINKALKGNKAGRRWESLVGYACDDLIKHLNKTIPQGYTWQDYLEGKLHIDHIIPISAFNYTKTTHADFKRCWSLKNLRLLPAKENLSKSNRLTKPFQPALQI